MNKMNAYDSIINKLSNQCNKTPQKTAIKLHEYSLKYNEFYTLTKKIIMNLQEHGVKENQVVCITGNRSIEMVASIFAVLSCHCCFYLLDQQLPQQRQQYILNVVKPTFIITQNIIEPTSNTETQPDIFQLAYIIFSSGTTNKPKGICIDVKSFELAIDSIADAVNINDSDTIIAATSISFDPFLVETVIALCRGLTVILTDEKGMKNPRILEKLIFSNKVTVLQTIPSKLRMFKACAINLQGLQKLLIGGELLSEDELKYAQYNTGTRIYNLYGLTEVTIWSSVIEILQSYQLNHIGIPINGHEIYLLDQNLKEIPPGQVGQIYLAGWGICRGYVNEKLILHEVPREAYTKKLFATGDLGKMDDSGLIKIIGRLDHQVKVNGYRVNLEEVEQIALNIPNVTSAVAASFQNKQNNCLLCLYYTAAVDVARSTILTCLKQNLPNYMVPKHIFNMEDLPHLPNGKIDRKNKVFKDKFKQLHKSVRS